jgi:SRSO17 transposase
MKRVVWQTILMTERVATQQHGPRLNRMWYRSGRDEAQHRPATRLSYRNFVGSGEESKIKGVGAQHPRAQGMQWFLSESNWQERQVQERHLRLLLKEPGTAPNGQRVLVIDEHGDRKRGYKTAHIGKQYLANLGKLDTGVVSVTSLWADEGVYYPVDFDVNLGIKWLEFW